jgi:hypothetical protein
MSAVESGPPDTASTSAGKPSRPANSALASASEIGLALSAGMTRPIITFRCCALGHVGTHKSMFENAAQPMSALRRKRPNCCVAERRRDGPIPDIVTRFNYETSEHFAPKRFPSSSPLIF